MFISKKLSYSSLAIALCLSASAMKKDPKGTLIFDKTPFSKCCIKANDAKINVTCAASSHPQLAYDCGRDDRCELKTYISNGTLFIEHTAEKAFKLSAKNRSHCAIDLTIAVPPNCDFKVDVNQLEFTANGDPLGNLETDINAGTIKLNAECKNFTVSANDVRIECPKTIREHLNIHSNSASIKATDILGDVQVASNKGTLTLESCKNCTFNLNNGSLECTKKIQGNLTVHGNKNNIKIADMTGNVIVTGNKTTLNIAYLNLPAQVVDLKMRSNILKGTLRIPANANIASDIKIQKPYRKMDKMEPEIAKTPLHFNIRARANRGSIDIQKGPVNAHLDTHSK